VRGDLSQILSCVRPWAAMRPSDRARTLPRGAHAAPTGTGEGPVRPETVPSALGVPTLDNELTLCCGEEEEDGSGGELGHPAMPLRLYKRRRGEHHGRSPGNRTPGLGHLPYELLLHIFSHLDSSSLAVASEVCKTWSRAVRDINATPRWECALSDAADYAEALEEASEALLDKAFIPDFVMLFCGPAFDLKKVVYHLRYLLPRPVPILAAHALGNIFGPDAKTGKTRELQWELPGAHVTPSALWRTLRRHTGLSLVMGRLPNYRVEAASWSLQREAWKDRISREIRNESLAGSIILGCQHQ